MDNQTQFQIKEDLHQADEYARFMEGIGWKIERLNQSEVEIKIFLKKLGPWSIAKIQRPNELPDLQKLEKVLKDKRVFMCKIEPKDNNKIEDLYRFGYKKNKSGLLGSKTLRIDLALNTERLLASFKKDCRYTLRKLEEDKHDKSLNEFETFYSIWKKSAKRKNLWIPSNKDYKSICTNFGDKCFAITIDNEAGALILMHKKTAFYYYAGATKLGTERNLPYLVVWEAMKHAKTLGCITWDFEGIFDSKSPNNGWKGFSHFKKSFGGSEIEFPGCFTKWRWP